MTGEDKKTVAMYLVTLLTEGPSSWDQSKSQKLLEFATENLLKRKVLQDVSTLAGYTEILIRFLEKGGQVTFKTHPSTPTEKEPKNDA